MTEPKRRLRRRPRFTYQNSVLYRYWQDHEPVTNPVQLTADDRAAILGEIRPALRPKDADLLITRLESEIATFRRESTSEKRDQQKLASRRQIERLGRAAEDLTTALKALDKATLRHLAAGAPPAPQVWAGLRDLLWAGANPPLYERLCKLHEATDALSKDCAAWVRILPSGRRGLQRRKAPALFAAEVAFLLAIMAPGRVPLSNNNKGRFEFILKICLSAARNGRPGDVHHIARDGLALLRGPKKKG